MIKSLFNHKKLVWLNEINNNNNNICLWYLTTLSTIFQLYRGGV